MGDSERTSIMVTPEQTNYASIASGPTTSARRPSTLEEGLWRSKEDTVLKRVPGLKRTWFGKFKGFDLLEREEWLFLTAGIISLITTLCFTIYRLIVVSAIGPASDDMLLGIILLINIVFCCYYLFHGVSRDQYFDVVTFLITMIAVICYVFLNFFGTDESNAVNKEDILHPRVKMARLIVTCLLGLPVLGLGAVVIARYWRSNYMLFRLVGARTDLQSACSNVLITHTLISLAVNAALSFLVAAYYMDLLQQKKEAVLLFTCGIAFIIAWAIIGYLSVRFEKTIWTVGFIILAFLPPAFAIWQAVSMSDGNLLQTIRFGAVVISTVILTGSSLMLVLSAIYAVWNYNKGLYERMYCMDDDEAWRIITSRQEISE